ncbi:MAG: hypothetical protein A2Z64_06235 [Betaproteobacteria bacterium RIFCSPLOWO2_02_67_12]|nr:MAG: hypothetical protein A2Z64_06235 [Betaproteobacteria bacterium RIFCSPLOWO2_02_67_12]
MARLKVEVVHALPGLQRVVALELEEGASALDAVRAAGIGAPYASLAIYGQKIEPGTKLRDGDRIELLRPLAADPNAARRRRAQRPAGRR